MQRNGSQTRWDVSFASQLIDYDCVRRSADSQKKGTPEFERMAQRQHAAEAGLVALTNEINSELNALEARRSVDMKNELLTVVACQVPHPTLRFASTSEWVRTDVVHICVALHPLARAGAFPAASPAAPRDREAAAADHRVRARSTAGEPGSCR